MSKCCNLWPLVKRCHKGPSEVPPMLVTPAPRQALQPVEPVRMQRSKLPRACQALQHFPDLFLLAKKSLVKTLNKRHIG